MPTIVIELFLGKPMISIDHQDWEPRHHDARIKRFPMPVELEALSLDQIKAVMRMNGSLK